MTSDTDVTADLLADDPVDEELLDEPRGTDGQSFAAPGQDSLVGVRIALVGRLAGMSRRDAQRLLKQHGARPVDEPDDQTQIVVLGEQDLLPAGSQLDTQFGPAIRQAVDEGRTEVLTETQLWQRLGLVETEQHIHRLYTPAMLADLLQLPVATVRSWIRRKLIVPVREVRRLPYFDFQEVSTARRLAEALAAGMSAQAIEKKLKELARYVPSVERPLAQLSIIIQGKNLLMRQGDGLVAAGGQRWFDFSVSEEPSQSSDNSPTDAAQQPSQQSAILPIAPPELESEPTVSDLLSHASRLEEDGDLEGAADMYRTALSAGGPAADICFALAEVLYRLGDATGARERYFMAIELDEEYVEARANLGCVLAELGKRRLAVAAFEGALAFHPDYADAHYHLAQTLDDLGERDEAVSHWRAFLELAPESPWAAFARRRLAEAGD